MAFEQSLHALADDRMMPWKRGTAKNTVRCEMGGVGRETAMAT